MGNDTSVLQAFTVNEDKFGDINPWALNWAVKNKKDVHVNNNTDSVHAKWTPDALVLTAKLKSYGQVPKTMENAVEHVKRLRHPTILRFLGSCCSGDTFYLFTEPARPLSMIFEDQTLLEICDGLYSIGLAVQFLHETANSVHSNIQEQSVFVDSKGEWKLGGFDYAVRMSELTREYLDQIRSHRPPNIIPPEEEQPSVQLIPFACDIYALGVLTTRCVAPCIEEDFPEADSLSEYASKHLKHKNPARRPSASSFIQHPFFSNPYLQVKDFLSKLALKTPQEKEVFFKNLPESLRHIPQTVIGQHLSESLLSRLVLLETCAQKYFLPHFLLPAGLGPTTLNPILNVENFRLYVTPILAKILHVRDAEIRTVLLMFFSSYAPFFDCKSLEEDLLPELLLGIKDTHDDVVAATLRALADLVPILGSATVVGKRERIFGDGKPKAVVSFDLKHSPLKITSPRKKSSSLGRGLPERIPPDGGEDIAMQAIRPEPLTSSFSSASTLQVEVSSSTNAESEDWSDWDRAEDEKDVEKEDEEDNSSLHNLLRLDTLEEALAPLPVLPPPSAPNSSQPSNYKKKKWGENGNLGEEFDVLMVKVNSRTEIDDLFADMEPKLVSPMTQSLSGSNESPKSAKLEGIDVLKNKLAFQINVLDDTVETSGWGCDLEWNEDFEAGVN